MKGPAPTAYRRKAVLVAARETRGPDRTLEELELLTGTAGGTVVGRVTQNLVRFNPSTLIGAGKVEEVRELAKRTDAGLVIFDNALSPAQTRNLEKALDVAVMDRTELILDVFATHARTSEAKLQVELARLQYMMPRLVGRKKSLEQIMVAGASEGGLAAGRGPGEKQIEYDRRVIRRQIFELKERIREVERRRERLVRQRTLQNFAAAIVGYTNAGKSTLMNALTRADVTVDDRLFSTLDTKTRTWELRGGMKILLSDTVGFIRDLPHQLVTSFTATLAEVKEVHLLLLVADASDPRMEEQIAAVRQVLVELGSGDKPSLLVFNKIDAVGSPVELTILRNRFPDAVCVSALRRQGLDDLERRVLEAIRERVVQAKLKIPVTEGKVLAEIQDRYAVSERRCVNEHVLIEALIPKRDMYKYERYSA
jgi:GTP-binding protein HflX